MENVQNGNQQNHPPPVLPPLDNFENNSDREPGVYDPDHIQIDRSISDKDDDFDQFGKLSDERVADLICERAELEPELCLENQDNSMSADHDSSSFDKDSSTSVRKFKLIDFKGRERAEPARLIFAYAGVSYTDERIEQAVWPGLKSTTPLGRLPVLDIDNGKVVLGQTKAIARYLGGVFNMIPKDHIQAARGDMLVYEYEDVQKEFGPWLQEKDPAKKKALRTELEQEHMVPFLALYEKFLVDNGSTYFLGDSITWADLFLFDALYKSKQTSPHLFDGYPKLTEFISKIETEPKIHGWLEKRPKSEF